MVLCLFLPYLILMVETIGETFSLDGNLKREGHSHRGKRGVMTARKHSVWSRIVSTVDLSGHYDWVDQFQGRSSSILFAG